MNLFFSTVSARLTFIKVNLFFIKYILYFFWEVGCLLLTQWFSVIILLVRISHERMRGMLIKFKLICEPMLALFQFRLIGSLLHLLRRFLLFQNKIVIFSITVYLWMFFLFLSFFLLFLRFFFINYFLVILLNVSIFLFNRHLFFLLFFIFWYSWLMLFLILDYNVLKIIQLHYFCKYTPWFIKLCLQLSLSWCHHNFYKVFKLVLLQRKQFLFFIQLHVFRFKTSHCPTSFN